MGVAVAQPSVTTPDAPAVVSQQELPAKPSPNEPVVPDDPELSSKTAEPDPDWKRTENPKATVVPGQMRSDREEIPAPFTKADADKAETMEAEQIQRQSTRGAGLLRASVCQTYWPSPFQVCDAIRDKYNSLGGPTSFLSFPSSGNITNPDGTGQRVTFLNGPIYWSPQGGAHPVVNSFLNRWGIHGYEAGWLKYPTTDEILLPDGGRRQEFEFGAIYVAFQNAIGSAIKNGPIRDKWNTIGGTAPGGSLLGYPIQDEVPLPDGQGRMGRFERGVLYWHPIFGAHPVTGTMLLSWELNGFETGSWGYPASDQFDDGGVPSQTFENHVVDLNDELAVDDISGSGVINFNHGRAVTLSTRVGTLNAARPSTGYDTRYLAWGWKLSDNVILNKTSNGINTGMRCRNDTERNGQRVNFSSKDGISVTYHYHGSLGGHDDSTLYSLFVSCSFTNETLKKNGKGVLAFGVSSASFQMAYRFLTS